MVKDYGKICASAKSGKVFYGKRNTILWKDCPFVRPTPPPIVPTGMPCQIDIAWSDVTGTLLIVGFWTKSVGTTYNDPTNTNVGFDWSSWTSPWPADDTPPGDWPQPVKNVNGYMVWWDGRSDKPPYKIRIDCEDRNNVDDSFQVRCHWLYEDHGTATLWIKDNKGNRLNATVHPNADRVGRAEPTDPGFIMRFRKNGVIDSLETVQTGVV